MRLQTVVLKRFSTSIPFSSLTKKGSTQGICRCLSRVSLVVPYTRRNLGHNRNCRFNIEKVRISPLLHYTVRLLLVFKLLPHRYDACHRLKAHGVFHTCNCPCHVLQRSILKPVPSTSIHPVANSTLTHRGKFRNHDYKHNTEDGEGRSHMLWKSPLWGWSPPLGVTVIRVARSQRIWRHASSLTRTTQVVGVKMSTTESIAQKCFFSLALAGCQQGTMKYFSRVWCLVSHAGEVSDNDGLGILMSLSTGDDT